MEFILISSSTLMPLSNILKSVWNTFSVRLFRSAVSATGAISLALHSVSHALNKWYRPSYFLFNSMIVLIVQFFLTFLYFFLFIDEIYYIESANEFTRYRPTTIIGHSLLDEPYVRVNALQAKYLAGTQIKRIDHGFVALEWVFLLDGARVRVYKDLQPRRELFINHLNSQHRKKQSTLFVCRTQFFENSSTLTGTLFY